MRTSARRAQPPPENRSPGALAGARGAGRENSLDGGFHTPNPARLQHLAGTIHRLGPRALYELLLETLERPADNFLDRLEAYAALSPDQLRVTGGDQLPPTLFAVEVDQ